MLRITQILDFYLMKIFLRIVFEKICLIYHDNLNFERPIEKLFLIFDRFFSICHRRKQEITIINLWITTI